MSENPQGTIQDAGSGDLVAKLAKFEKDVQILEEKNSLLEKEIKEKDEELTNYKSRMAQLSEEAGEAQKLKVQHLKETEDVNTLKTKSEETLTRAKSMLFEKEKVIQNQELQIDALNQQISSLKDVVSITKDLLEIRNLEIKQLETKIKCIEDKFAAEKERHNLMHKKLENMIRFNGELRTEYESQLAIFSDLREKYKERVNLVEQELQEQGSQSGAQTAEASQENAQPVPDSVQVQENGTAEKPKEE